MGPIPVTKLLVRKALNLLVHQSIPYIVYRGPMMTKFNFPSLWPLPESQKATQQQQTASRRLTVKIL